MKVKRLKDVSFGYDEKEYNYPFSIDGSCKSSHLTKREALSFIKWALLEGEWTENELVIIHSIIDAAFINRMDNLKKRK